MQYINTFLSSSFHQWASYLIWEVLVFLLVKTQTFDAQPHYTQKTPQNECLVVMNLACVTGHDFSPQKNPLLKLQTVGYKV